MVKAANAGAGKVVSADLITFAILDVTQRRWGFAWSARMASLAFDAAGTMRRVAIVKTLHPPATPSSAGGGPAAGLNGR